MARLAGSLAMGVLALLPFALASPLSGEDAAPTHTAVLAGRVDLIGPTGRTTSRAGSVVWLPGVRSSATPDPRPIMSSRAKRFDPHVLAVAQGTAVSFPNVDSIYHNVFSLSPGNAFDLGLYRKGAARTTTLRAPGVVHVYCNIHPEMAAYILVVEGTAVAVTDEEGRYRIAGIPPGRHDVRAWNEMAGEQRAVVDFPPGGTVGWDLTLDGSQYRAVVHKNKHGKSYPPATRDVDRY